MLWVGITGSIGSGKSTFAQGLRARGYAVIDADEVSHRLLLKNNTAYKKVVQDFGLGILNDVQEIDRKKLGALVFRNKKLLSQLESILHPLIREEVAQKKAQWEREGKTIAFYDVPLLFEKNMESLFDEIVLVYAPEALVKERVQKRSGLTVEEVHQRLLAQIPIEQKKKRAHYVVDNSQGLEHLNAELDTYLLSKV